MTDVYDEGKYNNTIRTLNYSKEIINELFAGLNVNFVHLEFIDNVYVPNHGKQKSSDAVTIDFGILKNFVIDNSSNKSTVKIFRLGASIYNIGNTEIADNNHSNKSELLPVIFRAGMSFDINFMNRKQSSVSSDVQSFSHVEYEDILNDNADFPVVKFGEELTIADFLILRAGVISSRSYPSKVDAFKSEFTFGAGFKANFNKLFKSSDRAGFILDYAATQPTTKILEEGFLLWSLKINYIP
jgi:hypothetical protein